MKGSLYLIPCTLGESSIEAVLPSYNRTIILGIKHFVVENIRSARRFLKATDKTIDIDQLVFYELNKHTSPQDIAGYIQPAIAGEAIGLISEAGCPAVADPGAQVVALAHQKGVRVIPLVGPSSILLALMASGFNGQNFAFNGYIPVKNPERLNSIRSLEKKASHQSQILIETPFRNNSLLEELLQTCSGNTLLCIAADITLSSEYIQTHSIAQWKKKELPELHKRPCIFILGS